MRLVVRWLIRSRRQIGGLRRYRARDRAYDGNTEREQSIHRSIPLTPEFNRPRVVRQRLANGLVSRRTDHASRATSALARARVRSLAALCHRRCETLCIGFSVVFRLRLYRDRVEQNGGFLFWM